MLGDFCVGVSEQFNSGRLEGQDKHISWVFVNWIGTDSAETAVACASGDCS